MPSSSTVPKQPTPKPTSWSQAKLAGAPHSSWSVAATSTASSSATATGGSRPGWYCSTGNAPRMPRAWPHGSGGATKDPVTGTTRRINGLYNRARRHSSDTSDVTPEMCEENSPALDGGDRRADARVRGDCAGIWPMAGVHSREWGGTHRDPLRPPSRKARRHGWEPFIVEQDHAAKEFVPSRLPQTVTRARPASSARRVVRVTGDHLRLCAARTHDDVGVGNVARARAGPQQVPDLDGIFLAERNDRGAGLPQQPGKPCCRAGTRIA